MAPINILKFGASSPADASPLKELQAAGYHSEDIIGVIGKSEGNGCVNDFSRTLSTHVWEPLIPEPAVTIFSGGTEGVLSPHVTFIVKTPTATGLQGVVGHTRRLEPHEVGTAEHAQQVAISVRRMLQESGISKDLVHLVLIKCPLLTSTKMEVIKAAGKALPTSDTYESMAKSRYASAVGIAVALDEMEESRLHEAIRDETSWSKKASCSSGAELEDCHILIIASEPSPSNLRVISGYMRDAIDAEVILGMLQSIRQEHGIVVQAFGKAEADPRGKIRGSRHTMLTDSDFHSTRHARAAVGGLVAGLVGDTQVSLFFLFSPFKLVDGIMWSIRSSLEVKFNCLNLGRSTATIFQRPKLYFKCYDDFRMLFLQDFQATMPNRFKHILTKPRSIYQ
jgi:cyanuric acid amidohydrolase